MYNNLRAGQKGLRGDQWACVANGVISAGLDGETPSGSGLSFVLLVGQGSKDSSEQTNKKKGTTSLNIKETV